ncbi:MAG: glycosyltransferase [Muribaculum sp.]|nr:glycosyltransferase [Muribaculum sp.]
MDRIKVSIITVCYNAVSEIESTIRSVLAQSYENLEYIVVDGGSTDGTLDILNRYSDCIHALISEPDKGIFDAMNKGITLASGDYINFMNAGDSFYSPDSISNIMRLKKTESDFLAGIAVLKSDKRFKAIWDPVRTGFSLPEVANGGACCHQACLIHRSAIRDGYPLAYGIIADDLYLLEKVALGSASYEAVNTPVAVYDTEGVSNSPSRAAEMLRLRTDFFAKHGICEIPIDTKRRTWRRMRRIPMRILLMLGFSKLA